MEKQTEDIEGSSFSNHESEANAHAGKAPFIFLTKGGGAIPGMGEKFAVNPLTGKGLVTIPIAISSGQSGFGSELSLSYDSIAGNGPFDFRWNLALLVITPKTDKGLPQYLDCSQSQPHCDVFVLSYAKDIEGLFARSEQWMNHDDPHDVFWHSITRDNITTWCGKDKNSRIANPTIPTRIFNWLIFKSNDYKGNVMGYRYKEEHQH